MNPNQQLWVLIVVAALCLPGVVGGQECDRFFTIDLDKESGEATTFVPGEFLSLTVIEEVGYPWPTTPTLVMWAKNFGETEYTEGLSNTVQLPSEGFDTIVITVSAKIPAQAPDCPEAWSQNAPSYTAHRFDATPSPPPPPSPSPTPTCTPKQMDCSVVFDPWPDRDGYLPLTFEFGFHGYAIYDITGPGSPTLEHLGGTSYRISGLEYDSAYQMPWSCEVEECTGEPDNYLRLFPTVPRPTGWQATGSSSRSDDEAEPARDALVPFPERIHP